MRADLYRLVLFYKLQSIAYNIGIQRDLIICLHVHEVVQIAVLIQILHIFSVNVCIFKFLSRTESLLNNTAADDIFQLSSYKSRTFSRFYMLKFHNLINISVNFHG